MRKKIEVLFVHYNILRIFLGIAAGFNEVCGGSVNWMNPTGFLSLAYSVNHERLNECH